MTSLDSYTLAAIVRSSDDAIVTKTLQGIITSWNAGAERLFGYTADEVIGQPATILFPPDRTGEEEDFIARITAGERVHHFETVRVRKDGALVDISVTLSPIRDAEGRIIGISKIARDISERKRADAARHHGQQLLAITLASIGDAVIATDETGRITFLNAVAERLTGWTADEARGEHFDSIFDVVNERTGQIVESPVLRVLRDGKIVALENHSLLRSRSGVAFPIDDSAAPIHDQTGRVFGVVVVFRDVTDRRRADRDVHRLAAIVESSDDAITSKTLQGIILSWNSGAERMFGYRAEEVIGKPMTILFPDDRLPEEEDFLARIARGERVEHFETIRIRKDGQQIDVSVTLSPILNEESEIVGVSTISRDVSERVRLAARERAAREDAEEANRVKDRFLATLSHELRTPLNAIYGWTRLLQSGTLDEPTARRALDIIERNTRAQVELVTELLDVSRILTGRVTLNARPIDLAEIVLNVVDGMRPAAESRGVALGLTCDAGVARVMGDPDRLQQVFWNLLSNAVKFTDAGGRVDLRVAQTDSRVIVTVADTGIGIVPEALPYVFEPFRQADASITRTHGGLGLGLSIARHVVDLHRGMLEACSEGPGRGATFTVTLPVAAVRDVSHDATTASSSAARLGAEVLHGTSILVVDDEADAQELVAEVLRRAGAHVITASTASEAMAALVAERPAVIVSDLGMPGEDGFSLLKRVRVAGDPVLAATPALALTAYARGADRVMALGAGFERHLAKPVDPDALVNAVAEVLSERRQCRPAAIPSAS
jgi:PAS domain S-box-containing protein